MDRMTIKADLLSKPPKYSKFIYIMTNKLQIQLQPRGVYNLNSVASAWNFWMNFTGISCVKFYTAI